MEDIGRACLRAAHPKIMYGGPGPQLLKHRDFIGPHHAKGDSVRYWVETLATSDNRILELPGVYLDSRVAQGLTSWDVARRDSTIDDHGGAYESTWQGPDINVALHVPAGAYVLSLYNVNDDGHDTAARHRDYTLSVEVLPPGITFHQYLVSSSNCNQVSIGDTICIECTNGQPPAGVVGVILFISGTDCAIQVQDAGGGCAPCPGGDQAFSAG